MKIILGIIFGLILGLILSHVVLNYHNIIIRHLDSEYNPSIDTISYIFLTTIVGITIVTSFLTYHCFGDMKMKNPNELCLVIPISEHKKEIKDFQRVCSLYNQEFMKSNRNHLITHLHRRGDKQHEPIIGTLVGVWENGELSIGWSKHNHLDSFNRNVGIYQALNRRVRSDVAEICARTGVWVKDGSSTPIPRAIRKKIESFIEHAYNELEPKRTYLKFN